MTRERAKKLLPVIQAWAEGKTLQTRFVGHNRQNDWHDNTHDSPDFKESVLEWRVKPEPREFWMVRSEEGVWNGIYEQQKQAELAATLCHHTIIHVREVVE